MRISRRWFTLAISTAVALAGALPGRALAQVGLPCPSDACCAARPSYTDPLYSFTGDVLVGTREVEANTNACVTIFDITPPYPGDGVNFATVLRYHGPGGSWNVTNLGSVFGLTIDKFGNIFVCNTSCYGIDYPGPGGDGAVYRIANGTGAINVFCTLPNSPGVGLGNISYDCEDDQFFVTDHEDGKIYRIKTASTNAPTATIQESFDPMAPDNGAVGFAPLGERLWGVQWHQGRVYYNVWSENCNEVAGGPNSIRSVGLTAGAFNGGSDQLELVVPPHVNNYSNPVSDISFSPTGSMFLAERSMSGPSSPAAHESRLLEYVCLAPSGWAPSGGTYVLGVAATCCCSGIAGNGSNSSGGVDCDFENYTAGTPFGRVWGTSDAIDPFLTVYGIQGLPPGGGTPSVSSWVDFDGTVAGVEKTNLGDVEVPCKDVATAAVLSLFRAEQSGEALELRWKFGGADEISTIDLERAEREAGPWQVVAAERRAEGDVTVAIDREVEVGHTYYYRLVVNTVAGEKLTFGPVPATLGEAIARFALSHLSPNPSQGPISFEFSVPREASVRVSVVDVQGREVALLASGTYRAGRYTASWTGNRADGGARGGLFFIRYQTPAGSFMRRVVVTP